MEQLTFFRSRTVRVAAVALVLCSGVCGCASSDRLKKQVADLENQVTSMRADQDRMEERLAAVELNVATAPRAPAAPAAERVEHAPLKVVHLAPSDDSESPVEPVDSSAAASPDSPTRRPIIRGTGDRVIKVGDGDASDDSSRRDDPSPNAVATLGKETHGN
jgi:hypothetical protein